MELIVEKILTIRESFTNESDYLEIKKGLEEIIELLPTDDTDTQLVISRLLHTLDKEVKYLRDLSKTEKDYKKFHDRALDQIDADLYTIY